MTAAEFSRQFDIRFNNIDSNLAHSVTEYEKSVYLTQAQLEIVKNYFNPKGNKYQEGFDGSPKRDIDFSNIIAVNIIGTGSDATVGGGVPSGSGFGITSLALTIPANVLFILNERFSYNGPTSPSPTVYAYNTTVVPIDYKQYQVILGKAYKDPPIRQTWRLVRGGAYATGYINVELIPSSSFNVALDYAYYVRYIRYPQPILTAVLTADTSIQGVYAAAQTSELSPELHEEILARAIEICKSDYLGELPNQVKLNERVE